MGEVLQQSEGKEVTVCLTSCGRPDLLEITLQSFFQFNTFPISEFMIYEDSGEVSINQHLWKSYPQITWMGADHRKGQIEAIDRMYQKVKTHYIFHLEEDWEFYKSGFIEASKKILDDMPSICMVWIREKEDTNQHPIIWQDDFGIMKTNHNGLWGGFCFNPGLRRKKDYELFGSYGQHTQFIRNKAWKSEATISKMYATAGFRAAILKEGFMKHIGVDRHVQ